MSAKYMEKPTSEAVIALEEAKANALAEGRPVRILFVCLGNICRSPAAEGIMRSLIKDMDASVKPELDSAGFYGGHAGDLPDGRMRRAASGRGLVLDHRSRTIKESDFDRFDLIIGMDDRNISDLHDAAPTVEHQRKIARMSDFAVHYPAADCIPDPYWEGAEGFERVLNLLEDACSQLRKMI